MELGSEFNLNVSELSIKANNIFNYLSEDNSVLCFDSGRSAIRHFAKHFDTDDEILLPEFICESVSNCFTRSKISYYRLENNYSINLEDLKNKVRTQTKVIFLMHYFGKIQPDDILTEIRRIADAVHSFILEDTTHSVLSNDRTIGDYQVCSIRKWLPISKGGVLYYQDDPLHLSEMYYRKAVDNDRSVGMILKDLYLRNVLECNSLYRKMFRECEKILDSQNEIFALSDFARFIGSCTDIQDIIKKRKANYALLKNGLQKTGVQPDLSINDDECPFAFILRIPDRDGFRRYMMENRIYCAVHWPFDRIQEKDRLFAKINSEELISLPIDQRYDDKHINYMIDTVAKYGGKLIC